MRRRREECTWTIRRSGTDKLARCEADCTSVIWSASGWWDVTDRQSDDANGEAHARPARAVSPGSPSRASASDVVFPHVDEMIVEERQHLDQAVRKGQRTRPTAASRGAVAHARDQVHRAVTISQYEQILDAALRNLEPNVFFTEILGRVASMLEADTATVYLLEEKGLHLVARASAGLEDAVKDGVRIPVGQGVAGQVIGTRASATLDRVDATTVANPLLLSRGILSLVTVPVLAGSAAIGVFEVGWARARAFDPQEVRLLEVVAEQVGRAIERNRAPAAAPAARRANAHQRLVQPIVQEEIAHAAALLKAAKEGDIDTMTREAQAHAERQTAAATTVGDYEAMRDAALSTIPTDERLALMLAGARTLLGCDVAAVLLMDEDGQQLWPRASLGFATSLGVRPVAVVGSIRRVVKTDEPLLVADVQPDDEFRAGLAEEDVHSLVAVPMRVDATVTGVLICGHRSKGRFALKDVELLQLVGDRMAVGLARGLVLEAHARDKRRALQESQYKTDLLNMATHDIKTPLAALTFQLAALQSGKLSAADRGHGMDIMQRSVARLTAMLDDFLDLARVEAGRLTIKPGRMDVSRLLQDAADVFAAAVKQKGLKLEMGLTAGLQALGDERRIAQVVSNLVSNAIRYSPSGGTVRLGAKAVGDTIEVFVRDEGVGLSAEQIGLLFKPFSQVQGIAEETKGTGLGLYLSRAIIQAHGGKLWLESEGPSTGTRAVFSLPRDLTSAEPPTARPRAPGTGPQAAGKGPPGEGATSSAKA